LHNVSIRNKKSGADLVGSLGHTIAANPGLHLASVSSLEPKEKFERGRGDIAFGARRPGGDPNSLSVLKSSNLSVELFRNLHMLNICAS